MKKIKIKRLSAFISSLLIVAALCLPCSARNIYVSDNEGILSLEQAELLEQSLSYIYSEYGFVAAVATDAELDGKDIQSYADDLLDYYFAADSGIMLVVSDSQREYAFSTVGEAMNIFGGYEFDIMEENILQYLPDGRYYEAFDVFVSLVGSMADDYRSGVYNSHTYYEDEYHSTFEDEGYEEITYTDILVISLVAGVIVAFISVSVMKAQLKSVRRQNTARSYVKDGSMVLNTKYDRFLYRTVNRVRRQQNNSSSGGGAGVHRSSSGRSHGGRSGKF